MDKQRLKESVLAFRAGDKDAFNEIYEQSRDSLYGYARYLTGDETLVQDALQDTYLKIATSIDQLKDPEAFLTWSKTILRNNIFGQMRRGRKEEPVAPIADEEQGSSLFDRLPAEDESTLPGELFDKGEVRDIVDEGISKLSDVQRRTVTLFYYDDLSIKDIADIMDVSEGTVKSRLNSSRNSLKNDLSAYEEKHDIKLHGAVPAGVVAASVAKNIGSLTMPEAMGSAVLQQVSAAAGISSGVAATAVSAAGSAATAASAVKGAATAASAAESAATAASAAGGAATAASAAGSAATTASTVGAAGAASAAGSAAAAAAGGTVAATTTAAAGAAATGAAALGAGKIVAIVVAGVLAVSGIGFGIHHAVSTSDASSGTSQVEESASANTENPDAIWTDHFYKLMQSSLESDGLMLTYGGDLGSNSMIQAIDPDGDGTPDYFIYRLFDNNVHVVGLANNQVVSILGEGVDLGSDLGVFVSSDGDSISIIDYRDNADYGYLFTRTSDGFTLEKSGSTADASSDTAFLADYAPDDFIDYTEQNVCRLTDVNGERSVQELADYLLHWNIQIDTGASYDDWKSAYKAVIEQYGAAADGSSTSGTTDSSSSSGTTDGSSSSGTTDSGTGSGTSSDSGTGTDTAQSADSTVTIETALVDVNGDGTPELFFRKTDGTQTMTYMATWVNGQVFVRSVGDVFMTSDGQIISEEVSDAGDASRVCVFTINDNGFLLTDQYEDSVSDPESMTAGASTHNWTQSSEADITAYTSMLKSASAVTWTAQDDAAAAEAWIDEQ